MEKYLNNLRFSGRIERSMLIFLPFFTGAGFSAAKSGSNLGIGQGRFKKPLFVCLYMLWNQKFV
jgi:hypothetical protein